MIKAVIDLGTNTFKCVIAELLGTQYKVIRDYSIAVRLGEGLADKGIITPEASFRAMDVLEKILQHCREQQAQQLVCVGAMTLRTASNAEAFARDVKLRFGLDIIVLDGAREARLIWDAVQAGTDPREAELLVMDIGGGSTEVIRGTAVPETVESLPTGALTLTTRFLKSDPPTPKELAAARDHFLALLPSAFNSPHPGRLIACGGTATNLAAAYLHLSSYDGARVEGTCISRDSLNALLDRFQSMSSEHLRQVPGLQPQRAGIIVGGGIILSTAMQAMRVEEVTVSTAGIRHALLLLPETELRL